MWQWFSTMWWPCPLSRTPCARLILPTYFQGLARNTFLEGGCLVMPGTSFLTAGAVNALRLAIDGADLYAQDLVASQSMNGVSSRTFALSHPDPKYVVVNFDQVSPSSGLNTYIRVQLGTSGAIEATGYTSTGTVIEHGANPSGQTDTTSFAIALAALSDEFSGQMILSLVTPNIWSASYSGRLAATRTGQGGGRKSLGGALAQVNVEFSGGATGSGGDVSVTVV